MRIRSRMQRYRRWVLRNLLAIFGAGALAIFLFYWIRGNCPWYELATGAAMGVSALAVHCFLVWQRKIARRR